MSGPDQPSGVQRERRTFLSRLSGLTMVAGLLAGYGTFVHLAGRFLYPARKPGTRWLFVAEVARFAPGTSLVYRTPSGATVTIARRTLDEGSGFLALSSICPHLGCQVHWEAANRRFFCPCHNGVFDPSGKATSGPPADAGQSLLPYALEVRDGLLYIAVSDETASLVDGEDRCHEVDGADNRGAPPGPGHDPCLYARAKRPFRPGPREEA
jgi:Rieske Fe-S protein